MINDYLEVDGLVFITVPAFNFLWSNEDKDAGHYRRYTTKSISDCLEKAGFIIEYKSYLFSPLPLPIFLSRSLPSKFGLNKNSDDLNKHKNEHTVNKSITQSIMDWFLDKEITKIKKGKTTSFGSSCFIIAKKI